MSLTENYKVEELLNDLSYLEKRTNAYKIKKDIMEKSINDYTNDIKVLKNRLQLIESAKQYYLKVVDICYLHSIKEMEDFVNQVLTYVFYDEDYKIRLDITNKRNKSITFYLIDNKKGLELPLRKGNGKGIKAVVSCILLTYYLLRMQSHYLFLDESFVNISSGYIDRFFRFIKLLCHKHNMCIVLITHDTRFPAYADKIYNVKKGVIKEVLL